MNIKLTAREHLAKTIAEDVFSVCPAGTVGLDIRDAEFRRALQKQLAERGLLNVYGEGEFPEHVRFLVAEGEGEAFDYPRYGQRTLFLVPKTLPAKLFLPENAERTTSVYVTKEDAEDRARTLAVSGAKCLILFYLSAADCAMTSISDVSGEDLGAFRYLADALAFIAEPPQKKNYVLRLTQLLKEGIPHFKAPFTRLHALASGTDAGGFAELTFLAAFLNRAAALPFLKLLTVGTERAETLYFLEECKEEISLRVFGKDGVSKIARHLRLLIGRYALPDAELESFFATLSAAVKIGDGGFLSAMKKEGVLQGFVKYPL